MVDSKPGCFGCSLCGHLHGAAKVGVLRSRAAGRGLRPHADLGVLIDSPVEQPALSCA